MKLIVGLGNPGKKHAGMRHNVGFVVLDRLANKLGVGDWELSKKTNTQYIQATISGEKVELLKPQTYMNDSGRVVAYVRNKHRELSLDDIYVVHDDLDINLGEYKIQKGRGPKDHNGIISIEERLGAKDFYRVRIGVENRGDSKISGEDYVLMKFSDEELITIDSVANEVVYELSRILKID
ncbi:aminoacyl-tRNA hydrolase [Patescibacteria group bacterium]